jgi:DNA-binding Lrp family transcriptional regulator
MVQLLAGFQISQALYVAAKLGVADCLVDGPRPVADIAATVGAQPDALGRLLRTLASEGVFTEVEPNAFGLTPLGATLSSDQPGSMRGLALTWMETHYLPFDKLLETVRSGVPAAELHYGEPFFSWLSSQPDQVAIFSTAMANLTDGIKAGALETLDASEVSTLVDVGGADGTLLAIVLSGSPNTRGILFDLPHVVAGAGKNLAERGVAERVEVVGGDFFEELPEADGYVLSHILHDWSDEEAEQILRNVATAGGSGARLLLVEFVLPAGDEPHISKRIDLTMLGMLTGRERSEKDWSALLDRAGFDNVRIEATPTPISLIHATAR